jgi:protein-S-isoprenylcysteine O-methyltransferase Ste14
VSLTKLRDLPPARLLDMPPVWLALFVALAWVQARYLPVWPWSYPMIDLLAGVLVGAGLLLMGLALAEMRRARTTIIPHLPPDALVTTGVFNRSRNPVYLGDTLVLAGLVLFWRAWPSLLLVPLFMWLVTDRFIRPEEARLRARFGAQFEHWARRVRRWL